MARLLTTTRYIRISDIEHKSKTKNYSRLKSCILLKVTGAGYKGSDSV